jgi:hypothetical protein
MNLALSFELQRVRHFQPDTQRSVGRKDRNEGFKGA